MWKKGFMLHIMQLGCDRSQNPLSEAGHDGRHTNTYLCPTYRLYCIFELHVELSLGQGQDEFGTLLVRCTYVVVVPYISSSFSLSKCPLVACNNRNHKSASEPAESVIIPNIVRLDKSSSSLARRDPTHLPLSLWHCRYYSR